jgi:hypothetical protein
MDDFFVSSQGRAAPITCDWRTLLAIKIPGAVKAVF